MTSVVVLLKHIVEACHEARAVVDELSGGFAEQGIVNPADIGFLCQSGGQVPSYFVILTGVPVQCVMIRFALQTKTIQTGGQGFVYSA